MPPQPDTSIGLASRFRLTVDVAPHDLGTWSKVSGLGGGGRGTPHRRVGPREVTLERRADAEGSGAVKAWLTSTAAHPGQQTATVELLDAAGQAVATWTLTDVVALQWSVAAAATGKMAIETLQLAHG